MRELTLIFVVVIFSLLAVDDVVVPLATSSALQCVADTRLYHYEGTMFITHDT